jgi:DNA-binding PadR family transcriptional regulator
MVTKGVEGLGTLEQLVLLAVARLPDDAYGVTIRQEIEARTGRSLSLGAIYPTLDRLEEKGFVSSFMADPLAVRGGRSRRVYQLEPAGADALLEARRQLSRLWAGLTLRPRHST